MTHTLTRSVIGNIRAELGRAEVSQSELAVRLGMSQGNISRWLNGRQRITTEDIERIAVALSVPVDSLLAVR